jgi:DNA-binding HxlR family transcriptional regulator
MLILRDAFAGTTRFDDFQKSLASPQHADAPVAAPLTWARAPPPRRSIHRATSNVLTDRGRDFHPVLVEPVAAAGSTSPRPDTAAKRYAGVFA